MYDGYHSPGVDHVVVLLLAQELVIALHEAVEAGAQEVHVLRVHNMAERVLVFSPDDTTLSHGLGPIAHGLEGGECANAEGCVRVGVGVWRRSAGM